jgi:hypothetical protein
MRVPSFAFGAAFTWIVATALAAGAPATVIVRGKIANIDAKSIAIAKADGTTFTAAVAPEASFATLEQRRFEQIKPTDFVGVTSVPGPNGTITAEEIHIFAQKGVYEGSFPWDHRPEGAKPTPSTNLTSGTVAVVRDDPPAEYTMTNASVTASSGMQLKVTYQGSSIVNGKCVGHAPKPGEKPCTGVAIIDVPPWTPVVAIVPGKPADAKAGLAVFATADADADGKMVVTSLVVEKKGVKPLF